MKRLKKLSDEELAAYIEGVLSVEILEKSRDDMDVDMFELLQVAMRAGACMQMPIQAPPMAWGMNVRAYKAVSEPALLLTGFSGLDADDEHDEFV